MSKEDVVDKPPRTPRQPIRGTPVLLGLLADVLATFAIGFVFGFVNRFLGGNAEVLMASLTGLGGAALGLFATAFGGYVCAVSAGRDEVRHAVVMGLALVLLGLATFMVLDSPTAAHAGAVLLSFPAACLGGYLRSQQRLTGAEDAPPPPQPLVELALPRCPFCLVSVRRDERFVVCRNCLAQQHEACWSESTQCAACRGTTVLVVKNPLPIGRWTLISGLVLTCVVAGYVALRPLVLTWFPVAAPLPQTQPTHPPAPVAPVSTATVEVRRAPRVDTFDVQWAVNGAAESRIQLPDKSSTGRQRLRQSTRLMAWIDRASGALRVLEHAPWHVREARVGARDVTELGRSLWVVTKEGSLAQLGLIDLQTTNEVIVPRVRIEFVDALPDGRLGWIGQDDEDQLVVGRYRPGEMTCQLARGVPREGLFVKGWQSLEADDFVIRFERGLGATNSVAWSWGEKTLERGEYNAALTDMLPDATTFLVDRVLRPDGSTLRVHEGVAGWGGGRPQPSRDGQFYVAMERGDALSDGEDGPRNTCAAKVCFYRLPDAALLGSVSIGVVHYRDQVLLLDQANLLMVLREDGTTDPDPIRAPDLFFAFPYDPGMVERPADETPQGR